MLRDEQILLGKVYLTNLVLMYYSWKDYEYLNICSLFIVYLTFYKSKYKKKDVMKYEIVKSVLVFKAGNIKH